MRCRAILALPLTLTLGGCAHVASVGQGADAATTVVGLSQGLAEANPVFAGAPALLVLKPVLPFAFRSMRRGNCQAATHAASVSGFGAAGWNLAILGGVAPPLAAIAGVGTAALLWDASQKGAVKNCQVRVADVDSSRDGPDLSANPFLEF